LIPIPTTAFWIAAGKYSDGLGGGSFLAGTNSFAIKCLSKLMNPETVRIITD
jgi:hypothetical protein